MFSLLADRFNALQRRLLGRGSLSEREISQALSDIRTLLLEADVNYKVVGHFIRSIEARLKEQNVVASLKPGEVINATLYSQLVELLGTRPVRLELDASPSIISLVGLQGTGKTTLAGKLAYRYRSRRPLLVACDPKRPAAAEQLKSVADRVGAAFYPVGEDVVTTCLTACQFALERDHGIVVLDTAGRLHIDEELMSVLESIEKKVRPQATLLVLDGMIGQDAVNQAAEFKRRLAVTACCFTKLDGDARGGAVVSVRHVTGLPVCFVGTGERPEDLDVFHPDRIASRILGMGDMRSLADKVRAASSPQQQRTTAERFLKGKFDLEDFLTQLRTIRGMGSLSKLLAMIPGGSKMEVDDRELVRVEALIQSMTPEERRNPDIIDGSRRRRIASGSGMSVADVNSLLRDFEQARRMARQMAGGKPRFRGR